MSPLDVGWVGGLMRATEMMLDTQADEPEREHAGEGLAGGLSLYVFAVRLNSGGQATG